MIPPVRPLLIGVLCSLTVFGPAAAWLHVAECQHEGANQAVSQEVTSVCQHSCVFHSHGDHTQQTGAGSSDSKPSDTGHNHDSDSCAICHSVALPNGVDWQLPVELSGFVFVESFFFFDTFASGSLTNAIPEPRGPPALIG